MKKISYLLIFFVLGFSVSFAQVRDNITTEKSGTSSVNATIIQPLTIYDAGTTNLGEFVISGTPYNTDNGDIFESVFLGFSIEGEPNHPFSITLVPELSNSIADIKIRTFIDNTNPSAPSVGQIDVSAGSTSYNVVLSEDQGSGFGTFYFELECYEVTAKSAGEGIFLQTVNVAYISL